MTRTHVSKTVRVYTIVVLTMLYSLLCTLGSRLWAGGTWLAQRVRNGTMWLIGGPGADAALTLHRLMARCRRSASAETGSVNAE